MKPSIFLLPVLVCGAALAQSTDLPDTPPPQVEEALRGRVNIFYQAHVSGKFREAFQVVADDSQDAFLAAQKSTYKGCEIAKITYSENFTKASVVTACKGEYRWHGEHMPVTMPLMSTWKVADGLWWWYYVQPTEVVTPWGIMKAGEGEPMPGHSGLMPDPAKAARDILNKVSVDKNAISLKQRELSSAVVHVQNQMPGVVTVAVDRIALDGLSAKIEPSSVPGGGTSAITFTYDPNAPAIACNACQSKHALGAVTVYIRITPLDRVFPVTITFPDGAAENPKPVVMPLPSH